MKKVKLNLNLGIADKAKFGLEDEKALDGDVVEVEDSAAAALIKCGWAVADKNKTQEEDPDKDPPQGDPSGPGDAPTAGAKSRKKKGE